MPCFVSRKNRIKLQRIVCFNFPRNLHPSILCRITVFLLILLYEEIFNMKPCSRKKAYIKVSF